MHENSNAGKERKKAKGNSRGLYNLGATVYDIMIEAGSLSMTWARYLDPGVILTQLFKHSVISAPKRILSQAYVSHRKIPLLALQTDIMMAIWVRFGYKPCLTVCIVSSRIGSPDRYIAWYIEWFLTHDSWRDARHVWWRYYKQMLKRLNTKFVNTYNRFILTYKGAPSLHKGIDDCFIETKRNETTDGLRFTETDWNGYSLYPTLPKLSC